MWAPRKFGLDEDNNNLESGSLSSSGLFLYGHNLEYLILQGSSKEEINDFSFLYEVKKETNIR